MKAEERAARDQHLRWQDRGPPGPADGGPSTWRGQRFRPATQKWANRGGRWKDYYNYKYGQGGTLNKEQFYKTYGKKEDSHRLSSGATSSGSHRG